MSNSETGSWKVTDWFKQFARPILAKTESESVVEDLDKQSAQIHAFNESSETLFPICLLGQAGVGKSTLINTLIAGTGIVVPSGGGTGPLTANALRVVYGDKPSFQIRYHAKKQVDKTRFILEAHLHRQSKESLPATVSAEDSELVEMELDEEEQKKSRTVEAIGQARLMVAGAQTAQREIPYLADALRLLLGQQPKFQTQLLEEDAARLERLREAMKFGSEGGEWRCESDGNPAFNQQLRDHACGFLAPLILEMSIHWPSPLLQNSLELIDLPGIGILSDAYASLTSDYLRNKAKAVMLVADSRGIRHEDAALLRNSGFLNRLLHSSYDPAADPVALIVVAVKIDDVAEENWRNDKAINGIALKSKAEHFGDQVHRCRDDIQQRLQDYLREVWKGEDGELSEGKEEVLQGIVANLQVFPVSAPQYRLLCSDDPEEGKPFLSDFAATNIPALRDAVAEIAQRCLWERSLRAEEAAQRFFGQLRARLEVLSAQHNEERQGEAEAAKFKESLDAFLAPLQREFDTRRGGFRNFLRKTVPSQIEARVTVASEKARKEINAYLRRHIADAHWKTLQAAVRREGVFYGGRHINLPHDFALRFEEPVAEVWSRGVLVEVRKETREFAEYQSAAVTKILDWARGQGFRVSTRLLEALVDTVQQHRQQVNAVGKEAVDDLRGKVREELIKQIEGPIRTKCNRFVKSNKDSGFGVKRRIIDLFQELAEAVVAAASAPAVNLLVERFREVDIEILGAFGEHSEPLNEAAEALVQRHEKRLENVEAVARKLFYHVEAALAAMPAFETLSIKSAA